MKNVMWLWDVCFLVSVLIWVFSLFNMFFTFMNMLVLKFLFIVVTFLVVILINKIRKDEKMKSVRGEL